MMILLGISLNFYVENHKTKSDYPFFLYLHDLTKVYMKLNKNINKNS